MLLQSSRRGLRGHYKTAFWILDHYEGRNFGFTRSKGLSRLLRKQSRERFRLISRARHRGFDINETVYLLKLYDHGLKANKQQQMQRAA